MPRRCWRCPASRRSTRCRTCRGMSSPGLADRKVSLLPGTAERSGAHPSPRQQDFVYLAVGQGEGGNRDRPVSSAAEVRLEVGRAVARRRGHRPRPGPALVTGRGHHDVGVRGTRLAYGKRHVECPVQRGDGDRRAAVGPDAAGQGDGRRFGPGGPGRRSCPPRPPSTTATTWPTMSPMCPAWSSSRRSRRPGRRVPRPPGGQPHQRGSPGFPQDPARRLEALPAVGRAGESTAVCEAPAPQAT